MKKEKSRFEIKDTRTFSEKAKSFFKSTLFWMGRKKGMIHTMNIGFKDISAVFFPKDFAEKYRYLGTSVWGYSIYYRALRISIHGPEHLQELANAIEERFYSRGKQTELVEQIKAIDPEANIIWGSISRFEKQLGKMIDEQIKTN